VETGRVISRRYLLQRLVKQGRVCAVYQGIDQVLQRTVAVKAVPARHVPAYRVAIRMTSHFSHPNIIGLYDLVVEPETLYVVEEYVEGDEFPALLQAVLTPYEVADFGAQICQALLYAGSSSHKVCHGDLTPTAVLRDRQRLVRVNNFALPSDLYYFENWSVVGSAGVVVSNKELPWGQLTEGRHDDDTRAVGLLLYQLLAGRSAGATRVDPPVDGQLRFLRGTPAELCETIARAVVRSHPQHIDTVETLYNTLRTLTDALEPPTSTLAGSAYQTQPQPVELPHPSQLTPIAGSSAAIEDLRGTGKLVSALPARESGNTGLKLSAYRSDGSIESSTVDTAHNAPTTVADVSVKLAAARRAAYPEPDTEARRTPFLLILLLGLLIFVLFFVVGYFAGHLLFAH
jgi:serine/threonine protein kinase